MYELPTTVIANNTEWEVSNKGDFRMVLDCFNALNDAEMDNQVKTMVALIIFYCDINSFEDIEKIDTNTLNELVSGMENFFNCGQTQIGYVSKHKLVDWNEDEHIIMSAVNKVANKEVRMEAYCHWWTFMGYYISIGESTFSTVVSIRDKIVRGKKLEKYEKDFRRDNPHYFTWRDRGDSGTEKTADELFNEIWNKE